MARSRVNYLMLTSRCTAVVYRIMEEIDYVIPNFSVLRARLHRCQFRVLDKDGSEGDIVDGFIRSSTAIHETFPKMIIPHESCDIPVLTFTQAF